MKGTRAGARQDLPDEQFPQMPTNEGNAQPPPPPPPTPRAKAAGKAKAMPARAAVPRFAAERHVA